MNCPACCSPLSQLSVGGVNVDLCREGCGGIWFDKSELEKFDEKHEDAPETLLRAMRNKHAVVDHSLVRQCPKCAAGKLKRHYTNSDCQVEVDSCEACQGVWLDLGELPQLRERNTTEAERNKIIDDYEEKHRKAIESGEVPERILAVFKLLF